jgi:MraZ protein
VLFTGQFEHTIDAKNRLAIPAEIRSRWEPTRHGTTWFAVPWTGGVIRLYPETGFHARAGAGELTLTPDEDEAELQATLFGLARQLDVDGSGRIRLPEEMLELTGLPTEVVLVGAGDRLEVRDRGEWRASKAARLAQLPELMRRISSKRRSAPPGG